MEIKVRKLTKYVAVEISEGSTTIDMGVLDHTEARALALNLLDAVYDLNHALDLGMNVKVE